MQSDNLSQVLNLSHATRFMASFDPCHLNSIRALGLGCFSTQRMWLIR